MPRLAPVPRAELAEFEPVFQMVEQAMGFLPNSLLTMARRPALLQAFAGLAGQVLDPAGRIEPGLKHLVSYVASSAAGCRYCQAHTSHSAGRAGVPPEKIESAFEFETSPLFDDAERTALRLARDAALVPSETRDEHFEALRQHFDEDQILELVAVISLFGWLNRWNDTLATDLEASPLRFARAHLDGAGWEPGSHA